MSNTHTVNFRITFEFCNDRNFVPTCAQKIRPDLTVHFLYQHKSVPVVTRIFTPHSLSLICYNCYGFRLS